MTIPGRRTLLTAALLLGLGMAAAQTQPPATPPTTPPPATPAPAQPAPAQPAPATPAPATPEAAPEQAPVVSEEATLTVGTVEVTLPALPDATLVRNFNTVLGAGAVYRGSVLGAIDQIAQALVTAGFTAVDAAEESADAATGDAAAGTTDAAATTTDAAAAPAATGTAATGTAAAPATTAPATTAPATGTPATGTTDTAAAGTATTDTAATTDTNAAGTGASATGGGLADLPEGVVRTFERGGQRFELRAYERGGFTVVVVSRIGGTAAPAAPAS